MAALINPYLELLIVEDDKIIGMLQKKVIQSQTEIPVSVFENGRLAMNYLNSRPSTHFLILLDINMPVMDGWEFLEELQTLKNGSLYKVVMVTSSINPADRATASMFPQVIGYYEKPLLTENVREIFEREEVRNFMSPPQVI